MAWVPAARPRWRRRYGLKACILHGAMASLYSVGLKRKCWLPPLLGRLVLVLPPAAAAATAAAADAAAAAVPAMSVVLIVVAPGWVVASSPLDAPRPCNSCP